MIHGEVIRRMDKKHVFIIGCKGIPAQYGGFETFVDELTMRKKSEKIKYHVSCMNEEKSNYSYNGAECFNIKQRIGGAFGKMIQVSDSLEEVCRIIKNRRYCDTDIYILGCRIGPFLYYYYHKIKKVDKGSVILVNPDGMEWRRSKWHGWQKIFLKFCERSLVKNSDIIIADSKEMKRIITKEFHVAKKPIEYIAYGAEIREKVNESEELRNWLDKFNLKPQEYYLIVGRFVPENNYEFIIQEFLRSHSKKKLVIISNIEKNQFYIDLDKNTGFTKEKRIVMAGTVYEKELLTQIRKSAFAYMHGHEVGGTNPSLLEALSCTSLNVLLNVSFNCEVAGDAAVYFDKRKDSLVKLISEIETYSQEKIRNMGYLSVQRMRKYYNWDNIVLQYEKLFLGEK